MWPSGSINNASGASPKRRKRSNQAGAISARSVARNSIIGIFLLAGLQTAASQDITYNGLYPAIVCHPPQNLSVACGPESCVEAGGRPGDHLCISLAQKEIRQNTRPMVVVNRIGNIQWGPPQSIEVIEAAKPLINAPLFLRLKTQKLQLIVQMQPGQNQITFGLSEGLPDIKDERRLGNAVFNRHVVTGMCQVVPADYCDRKQQ